MQFWFNIINHIKSLDGMNKWETNSVAVHHDPVTDPTGLNGKELSGNILKSYDIDYCTTLLDLSRFIVLLFIYLLIAISKFGIRIELCLRHSKFK